MVAKIHQHVWEVVRTVWPNRLGWGIACTECRLILLEGLPRVEVEAVMRRLAQQAVEPVGTAIKAGNEAIL